MRKFLPFFIFLIIAGCKKSKTTTAESYLVDTAASKIGWRGAKVKDGSSVAHFGTMKLKNGEITVSGSKITGGHFSADLSTISPEDLGKSEGADQLASAMKGAQFFNIEKFPEITFNLKDVKPQAAGDYNSVVSGNLTVRGKEEPVDFNTNVSINKDEISIATEPKDLSLQDFGIGYKLPSADGEMSDVMNVQIFIKAKKGK